RRTARAGGDSRTIAVKRSLHAAQAGRQARRPGRGGKGVAERIAGRSRWVSTSCERSVSTAKYEARLVQPMWTDAVRKRKCQAHSRCYFAEGGFSPMGLTSRGMYSFIAIALALAV